MRIDMKRIHLPLLRASVMAACAVVATASFPKVTPDDLKALDGTLTPSGWSTRGSQPFSFTPGQGLIQGWTDGVLQMREGERAVMHVPFQLGYGTSSQGSKGGAWYIPGSSNLHFDIEILSKEGSSAPEKEDLSL
jgi:hypothetical protein